MPWVSPSCRTCTYTASHRGCDNSPSTRDSGGDVHFLVWGISRRLTTSSLHIRLARPHPWNGPRSLSVSRPLIQNHLDVAIPAVLRIYKEPSSHKGLMEPSSARLMSWICNPPRQTRSGNGGASRSRAKRCEEKRHSKRWPSSKRSNHQPSWPPTSRSLVSTVQDGHRLYCNFRSGLL